LPRSDRAALLERAIHQQIDYDERSSESFQRGLVDEALGLLTREAPDVRARHWRSNRNSDLYRFDGGGRSWLLKILTSKPGATIECEYRSLEEVSGIARRSRGFGTPEPLHLFEGRSAYLMTFVDGLPLPRVLADRATSGPRRVELVRDCGQTLGAIHDGWSRGEAPLAAEGWAQELSRLPWKPTDRERAITERVMQRTRGVVLPRTRLYLDFDPANIAVRPDGSIVLLDPPEYEAADAVHWDVGTFLSGLDRIAWRHPLARRRLRRERQRMRQAFLDGYGVAGQALTEPHDELLVALGELVRLAQLWIWWMQPLSFRHRLTGVARMVYAYPLLQTSRRARFGHLARLLDEAV